MKKILVIGTGGTIACKQSDSGLVPVMTAEELLSHVPDAGEYCSVESLQLCNIDSTDVTPARWVEFAGAVKDNYESYDGFVICHGTDTMAYTAAALSYLIQDSPKPIVVTGAQKPIDAVDTDARRNLRDSLIYASDGYSRGVVVIFDGEVIAGTRARKERSKSFDAFTSINYPCLALIKDGKLTQYIKNRDERRLEESGAVGTGGMAAESEGPKFFGAMSDKVFILKLMPGMSGDIIPELFSKYSVIIVESFGVGGIPSYLMDCFRAEMEKHDTIVIMATQVAEEGSDMTIYQVGHDVKYDFDLLETYDMTLEAAFAKACYLQARKENEGLSREEFKWEFYRPIGKDISI